MWKSLKIRVIDRLGVEHEIPAETGRSLMQVVTAAMVDGVEAECGGALACATCHVYVHPDDLARLQPILDAENTMLECTAAPRKSNSRLSCQVVMTTELDGLRVSTPEYQS
jgi:2Fe-2S ferredoxin